MALPLPWTAPKKADEEGLELLALRTGSSTKRGSHESGLRCRARGKASRPLPAACRDLVSQHRAPRSPHHGHSPATGKLRHEGCARHTPLPLLRLQWPPAPPARSKKLGSARPRLPRTRGTAPAAQHRPLPSPEPRTPKSRHPKSVQVLFPPHTKNPAGAGAKRAARGRGPAGGTGGRRRARAGRGQPHETGTGEARTDTERTDRQTDRELPYLQSSAIEGRAEQLERTTVA